MRHTVLRCGINPRTQQFQNATVRAFCILRIDVSDFHNTSHRIPDGVEPRGALSTIGAAADTGMGSAENWGLRLKILGYSSIRKLPQAISSDQGAALLRRRNRRGAEEEPPPKKKRESCRVLESVKRYGGALYRT